MRGNEISGQEHGGRKSGWAACDGRKRAVVLAVAVAWLSGGALSGGAALAQIPRQLPGAVEPGRDRPLLPEGLMAQPEFDLNIESPRRSPVPRSVDELRFTVRGIVVNGARTIPGAQLRPIYQDLVGKSVSLSDVLEAAAKVEDFYHSKGYFLTRVFVPPQRVKDGVFTINIVEGYVASVSVEGGSASTQARLKAYMEPVLAQRPVDLPTMERALLLANDLPGVGVSGVLRPAANTPGATDLVISVTESRIDAGIAADNRGSPYTGVWTLGTDFAVNSPTGANDQIAASVAFAPDSLERGEGQIRYRRPIGDDGLMASFFVTKSHGVPVSTLKQFDVVTDSLAAGPRLSYPLIRTRPETLILDGGFTVQEANVGLLGQPYSSDHWRVADVGATYIRNGFLGGNSVASFDVAQGLPFFGASAQGSMDLSRPGADTQFTKLTAAMRHTRTLFGPVSFNLSLQGQYSFEPLVAGEQVTFGGTQIGRGYDPAAVTGDHGVGASAELRYDLSFPSIYIDRLEPYAFFDAAKVWDIRGGLGNDNRLASTGVGLRVGLPHNISAVVEFAHTLIGTPGSDNGHRTSKILADIAVRY